MNGMKDLVSASHTDWRSDMSRTVHTVFKEDEFTGWTRSSICRCCHWEPRMFNMASVFLEKILSILAAAVFFVHIITKAFPGV